MARQNAKTSNPTATAKRKGDREAEGDRETKPTAKPKPTAKAKRIAKRIAETEPTANCTADYATRGGWARIAVRLDPRPEGMAHSDYWARELHRLRERHPELHDVSATLITESGWP